MYIVIWANFTLNVKRPHKLHMFYCACEIYWKLCHYQAKISTIFAY